MSRKIIGILQPVYLPWLGYFEQMAYVDHFVFLDDVQYTKHDWRNRNQIKTRNGALWLTVPVRRQPLSTTIGDTKIDTRQNWARKHLNSISHNYGNAPYFQPLFGELENCLCQNWTGLAELDVSLTIVLAKQLGLETETSFASAVPKQSSDKHHSDFLCEAPKTKDRNMRLIEICKFHGANIFYSGARSKEYIDIGLFSEHGIELVFQDYQHPEYPQRGTEFSSHMSVIDLIMNVGSKARQVLLSSPTPKKFQSQS